MKLPLCKILEKKEFNEAIKDIIYLYDRNYSERTVIQAVGNRYKLNREERMILFRGIPKHTYNLHINLLNADEIINKIIFIDGFNVLITIESYLNGIIVFQGIDGITRDIAGLHSKMSKQDIRNKAISALMKSFELLKPKEIEFILDKQVSKSGELSHALNELFKKNNINGKAYTNRSVDQILKTSNNIVCSSDSIIISKISAVFDLPYFIIKNIFKNSNPISLSSTQYMNF